MASKTTLNLQNLEALGAARLAALLLELGAGNAAIKRRLRLELAGATGSAEAAREVRKRLTTIGRARSSIGWEKQRDLVADLEMQRRAIIEHVAPSDPAEALDLLWRFIGLAGSVLDRCDDSSGTIMSEFHAACGDLGVAAAKASPDPEALADQAFRALAENDHGQYDNLVEVLAPALGTIGLDRLKTRIMELSRTPIPVPRKDDREIVGWTATGPFYADEIARSRRDSTVKLALAAVADAQGDADAFIALQSKPARRMPRLAAEIAERLLKAGRAAEALAALDGIDEPRGGWLPDEWQEARLAALEALGRSEEAQAFRWSCFERYLNATHLREYLKRLPDFEDIEAEERALAFVRASARFHEALGFLASWPALDRAADLVVARATELDGDLYHILVPAAEALEAKHQLAATLIRRALIDFTLREGRTSRYRHAARHLLECQGLKSQIEDFGAFETHEAYCARLQDEHGRKASFWSLLD